MTNLFYLKKKKKKVFIMPRKREPLLALGSHQERGLISASAVPHRHKGRIGRGGGGGGGGENLKKTKMGNEMEKKFYQQEAPINIR